MARSLFLGKEFKELYSGSNLQRVINSNPLPIKFTINDFECYFYNPDLFGLFELRINNDGLSTDHFIDDYRQGFEKGIQHLKKVEKIKLKDLKNVNLREHTINQLKDILHNREFKNGVQGLINTVKTVPLLFTPKVINDYGYWNGIMYSIDSLCQKAGLRLDELKTSEPQQHETDKPDEVTKELHNHIFKGNAFEVWQSMFESFQITESSRTDVKFMFEVMKKDGLIHNTVNQKTFLDWISETYEMTIEKTSNYSKTTYRNSIYSNAKQLYKS